MKGDISKWNEWLTVTRENDIELTRDIPKYEQQGYEVVAYSHALVPTKYGDRYSYSVLLKLEVEIHD